MEIKRQCTELNSLIKSFKNLQLEDKPRVETITVYKPLFNKDKTISQLMLEKVIETTHKPLKQTVKSRRIVSEFQPVFERELTH